MICISISQESRRLALVDMLNAAKQCDLLEVGIDRFAKAADIGELLAVKPKPVIMSCRRPQDGGHWEGSEDERLALLRQCIISKADYVEIELDVADQVRKFPPTRRVISYTNLKETPSHIADIYAEARTKSPDVIKLVTLARTPEEAWPLVQILAKPSVPTVVVGLGKPGLMLSILGKKMDSPWTYAALERGMEAYPGEPTVTDLEKVYHYRSIQRGTRLIGVTGFTPLEAVNIAMLNTAFGKLELGARCLPLQVGSIKLFRKVMEAVRLAAVVVDEPHRAAILEIAAEVDSPAKHAQAADVLVNKEDTWHAYNLSCRAAVTALETALRSRAPSDKPLEGRMVMVVGTNAAARAMIYGIKKRGGNVLIAGRERKAAQELAQQFDCRHIQYEALYGTAHEVLVVCSEEKEQVRTKGRTEETGLHPGFLKAGMTVMDLTAMPRLSTLLREAQTRGCNVVSPRQVLLEQAELQVKLIAGQDGPRQALEEVLNDMVSDEE